MIFVPTQRRLHVPPHQLVLAGILQLVVRKMRGIVLRRAEFGGVARSNDCCCLCCACETLEDALLLNFNMIATIEGPLAGSATMTVDALPNGCPKWTWDGLGAGASGPCFVNFQELSLKCSELGEQPVVIFRAENIGCRVGNVQLTEFECGPPFRAVYSYEVFSNDPNVCPCAGEVGTITFELDV